MMKKEALYAATYNRKNAAISMNISFIFF